MPVIYTTLEHARYYRFKSPNRRPIIYKCLKTAVKTRMDGSLINKYCQLGVFGWFKDEELIRCSSSDDFINKIKVL